MQQKSEEMHHKFLRRRMDVSLREDTSNVSFYDSFIRPR